MRKIKKVKTINTNFLSKSLSLNVKLSTVCVALLLTGCASSMIPESYPLQTPKSYQTQLQDQSSSTLSQEKQASLKNWWNQFNDPVLISLIDSAQNNNYSVAQSVVNLKNYEAILVRGRARSLPSVSASASTLKTKTQEGVPATQVSQLGLQSSWELDIFGANALATNANEKLLTGARADWHEARVLVAAEVARSYFNYQFCALSLEVANKDYTSRAQQNDITKLNVQAGFEASASAFASEASLAQAKSNVVSQKALCDLQLKSLVALTAIEEPELKEKLAFKPDLAQLENITSKANINLYLPPSIPGQLITQRPDVYKAVQELEASALNVAVAKAEHYPKVSISGNIFSTHTATSGTSVSGNSWNIGPLSVSLPIFEGGVLKANTELAQQKYEAAKINFDEKVRVAVKEVETAFIELNATQEKTLLNQETVSGYQASYEATKAKYEAGLSSLFELEDARRTYLASLNAQVDNQKERLGAWIDLYKALGGGFEAQSINA